MIEVEGKVDNQPIVILIDSGASHSYINANIVEIFHLQRSKHMKSWLVQLATGVKRKINELVKYCKYCFPSLAISLKYLTPMPSTLGISHIVFTEFL